MGVAGGWERQRILLGRRNSIYPNSHGESEAEGPKRRSVRNGVRVQRVVDAQRGQGSQQRPDGMGS